ncbi:hypothetical protein NDU88_001876 [Pleurodeles waltl]|uniref:Uncharacterized protein n=1 Tax=Pleurodeles waltl TaxID=8319 RepID=A0AAV7TJ19_PLEWA|nr:hypothetical protein NDU88_001876 [Pleurodeles waltl]
MSTRPAAHWGALPWSWLVPWLQPAVRGMRETQVKGEFSWGSQAAPTVRQATMEQEQVCAEVELRVGSPASSSSLESVEQQDKTPLGLARNSLGRPWAGPQGPRQEFPYATQLSLRVVPGGAISLRGSSLRAWEVAGIVEWGDLFEDHMLIPFDNLLNDFGVSPGTFMAYVAVTRQAAVRWDTLPREPDTSVLLQTLLTHGGERKAITSIYKALHMKPRYTLMSLQAYWEDTLCVKLTDTQ